MSAKGKKLTHIMASAECSQSITANQRVELNMGKIPSAHITAPRELLRKKANLPCMPELTRIMAPPNRAGAIGFKMRRNG